MSSRETRLSAPTAKRSALPVLFVGYSNAKLKPEGVGSGSLSGAEWGVDGGGAYRSCAKLRREKSTDFPYDALRNAQEQ